MKKTRVLSCIGLLTCLAILRAETPGIHFEYLASWGGPGKGAGEFRNPEGLAVGPAGFLYIADTGNHRIQKLAPSGEFVTEIGGFGWESGQFDTPVAVWAENGLDVFVADYQNHRIQRFDKDLHFIGTFRAEAHWPDHLVFGYPRDVALSAQGELVCLDGQNRRILKLDVAGRPQISFGGFDAGAGRLVEPRRLAFGRPGSIFVSGAEGITVFDYLGNFLYRFGDRILGNPADLCVVDDWIFVADSGLKEVVCFLKPGHPSGRIRLPQILGMAFGEPVAVACLRNRIYVLDRKRCMIDVFLWKQPVE